jgi:hypothetical protein
MAYTLRGRLDSRLAAALLPLLVALVWTTAARTWWPLELAGLMLGVGLALDAGAYHRLFRYQAGWLALPLGLVELAIVVGLVRTLGVQAPLKPALALFLVAWLVAQALGHAGFPLWRLSYAEDGGELGHSGPVAAVMVLAVFAAAAGVAWELRPPTVHLAAGIHRGPLVIDRAENLVGEPGAVVRGGIVIRASHVTVRDVSVVGGDFGIDVDGVSHVVLDRVRVVGARLDGIHVRRSTVTIKNCRIDSRGMPWAQGIDISYGFDLAPSVVKDCELVGGQEGIVTHFAMARLSRNSVLGTSMRGITMTEMSMGEIDGNEVRGALGIGIYCGDHSMCEVDRNVVSDTRPDVRSGDLTRLGYGILADYGAVAQLTGNSLVRSPGGVGAILDAHVERSP